MISEAGEERGVLYVATGERCRNEAVVSAESVKRRCPDLPIAVFTDAPIDAACFDIIRLVDDPAQSFLDKPRFVGSTPFRKTVFLDTDTFCLEPFYELYALLDRFDFAAAHSPFRTAERLDRATQEITYRLVEGVPGCFPEFNSGVLVYRKSAPVQALLADWLTAYRLSLAQPRYFPGDQATLCKLLYESGLRIATLTPEFNFRLSTSAFARGVVKILHDRRTHTEMGGDPRDAFARLGRAINAELGPRVFVHNLGLICDRGRFVVPLSDPTQRRPLDLADAAAAWRRSASFPC